MVELPNGTSLGTKKKVNKNDHFGGSMDHQMSSSSIDLGTAHSACPLEISFNLAITSFTALLIAWTLVYTAFIHAFW